MQGKSRDILNALATSISIALAIATYLTKRSVDRTEAEISRRQAAVDESRERVDRYKFVLSTLQSLKGKHGQERELIVAVTRLALTAAEATNLFGGLRAGPDLELSAVGQVGVRQARAQTMRNAIDGDRLERLGYQELFRGRLEVAALNFEAAHRADPYRMEASQLVSALRNAMKLHPGANGPRDLRGLYDDILVHYSASATAQELDSLRKLSGHSSPDTE